MTARRPWVAAVLLAACVLAACASTSEEAPSGAVEEEPRSSPGGVYDPWEPFNRGIFAFNEFVDIYLLEPVATGWDTIVPEPVQEGIDNFFENLTFPRRFANDWLQGKPRKAGDDFGRFLVNTIFGLGGFFDPASGGGYPRHDEDFGQTLGVWGVAAGPYLVLPFFGPSSPRDAAGLAVDGFVFTPEVYFVPFYVTYSATGLRLLNTRSLALEDIRAERESAFDFYAAARSAYVQFRANQVRDRADEPEEEEDEDFYYFDEDEDFDDFGEDPEVEEDLEDPNG